MAEEQEDGVEYYRRPIVTEYAMSGHTWICTYTRKAEGMSIDAKVVGVRLVHGDFKLTLEPRDDHACAGQTTLCIESPFDDFHYLSKVIGCDLWGNSSVLMLGDSKIADRISYMVIRFVPNWYELVKAYKLKRGR